MALVLPISKRGTVTLPPSFRRKIGLDRLENPLLLVEERDGRLVMEVAAAYPVRDLPEATLRSWVAEDEADGASPRKPDPD